MVMRKILFSALFLLLAMPSMAQYKITGDVSDIDDGTMVFLTLVAAEHVDIDSVAIKNGHFEFSGVHLDKPLWALIKIRKAFLPVCDFYLENGNITIKGERYGAKATGTPTNAQYNEYQTDINSMGNELYSLNVSIGMEQDVAKRDSLKAEFKSKQASQRKKEIDFIRRYPGSPVSGRIVEYLSRSMSASQTLELVNMLSAESQQDESMQQVKKKAEQLAKVEAGAVAPDFSLPTDKGEKLSLGSRRGKYVLIDFWASWCAPCRASFPAVAKLNEKYGKHLTILGVSLDRGEEAWRKALAEEKCTWVQLWDEKGVAAKAYAVSAIPLLVLVDPDGKIVGRYSKADITDELVRLFGE